jgi:hypothetical protein
VLNRVFRGKFVAGLRKARAEGKLGFHGAQKPLAQPKVFASFLRLLLSQGLGIFEAPLRRTAARSPLPRLLHAPCRNIQSPARVDSRRVTFRWRDSAHNNKQRLMSLQVDEFLRRFLLHVLPKGFVRIRHFGS